MERKVSPIAENGEQSPDIVDQSPQSSNEDAHQPTTDQVEETKDDSKDSLQRSTASSPPSKKRSLSELTQENEPISKKSRESPPATPSMNGRSEASGSLSPPSEPAPTIDKETWQGFCDIESDPAYFSVILREMGVHGVTVREVFAMDPMLLSTLPQPIHGLILLFHYREFAKEDQATTCPPNVWFANQLPAQSSCATLAMINILMNSNTVDVGEHLNQFKEFTREFSPFQRGEALASFDFVKKIHNSFAKKMDILESDKHLSSKVNRARRLKRQQMDKKNITKNSNKRSKGTKSRPRRQSADSNATDDSGQDYEENAHHYIAFVPVGNEVWKLDGLDAQPTSMGTFDSEKGETWLDAVSDTIASLMAAGDDDYGVIALTESPLVPLRQSAREAFTTLSCLEKRLDELKSTWRDYLRTTRAASSHSTQPDLEEKDRRDQDPETNANANDITQDIPPSPATLGILPASLPLSPSPDVVAFLSAQPVASLLHRRASLVAQLNSLANSIIPEIQAEADEEIKAAQRRYDTGPVIKKWLEMLAENGFLEANLERWMPMAIGNGRGGGGTNGVKRKK